MILYLLMVEKSSCKSNREGTNEQGRTWLAEKFTQSWPECSCPNKNTDLYREKDKESDFCSANLFFYHYFSIFYLRTFFVGRAVSFSVISHGHMQVWAGGGSEWIIKWKKNRKRTLRRIHRQKDRQTDKNYFVNQRHDNFSFPSKI